MNGCNLEWQPTIHDWQWGPADDGGAIDLVTMRGAVDALTATPLIPSEKPYDVRSIWDSRPVNAYDFNLMAQTLLTSTSALWLAGWQVPLGYRAIVREFEVQYDQDTGGPFGNSIVYPLQALYPSTVEDMPAGFAVQVPFFPVAIGGASAQTAVGFPVPNNVKAIGSGGKVKTFFIVEEGTWFGIQGINTNIVSQGSVTINVYGTFIPTRDEELAFVVGNLKS